MLQTVNITIIRRIVRHITKLVFWDEQRKKGRSGTTQFASNEC